MRMQGATRFATDHKHVDPNYTFPKVSSPAGFFVSTPAPAPTPNLLSGKPEEEERIRRGSKKTKTLPSIPD
jgi:hypothetical protein